MLYEIKLRFFKRSLSGAGRDGQSGRRLSVYRRQFLPDQTGESRCQAHLTYAEMESLYVRENYRGLGLGETLLSNAIAWMDEMGAHTKTVSVAVGNEKAFGFYEHFGFYPRKTQLEQIK